jgi:hypothetical protein
VENASPQVAGSESGSFSASFGPAAHWERWLDACPVALDDETRAGVLRAVSVAAGLESCP